MRKSWGRSEQRVHRDGGRGEGNCPWRGALRTLYLDGKNRDWKRVSRVRT